MILYTIKSGSMYLGVDKQRYLLCDLNKASVFSENAIQVVREHIRLAQEQGIKDLSIYRLTIAETRVE